MNEGEHPHRRWAVLSGLFFVYMASNGVTLHTLPLLYPELMETFGWKESEVTLPATIFFLVGALTSPPAGWLLDRYSSRAIIAIGSLLLSLGLMAYSCHPITMATGRRLRPIGTGTVTLWTGFQHGDAHQLVRRRSGPGNGEFSSWPQAWAAPSSLC
jgi:MFS family permease